MAQWERICLPMQGTWVGSLSWEDPVEEEMATDPSILAKQKGDLTKNRVVI